MLHSAPAIAPKPAALPAMAQNAPSSAGTAGGPSFAQLLSDQPAPQPPVAAAPAPGTPSPARAPETAAKETAAAPPPPSATQARRKEANAAAPKPATPAQPPAAAAGTAKATDATSASDDSGDAAEVAADADAADAAGLSEFTQLIGLAPPTAQPLATRAVGTEADTPAAQAHGDGDGDATAPATTASAEHRPADAPARATDATRAKGIELAADKAAASRTALRAAGDATQTTGSTPAEASPRAPGAPDPATPNFAALMAQALPAATSSADAAPAGASGRVHAALHSSAFAPELAANVSLLAVDGTQQAELQLNPADMGPVTVQIVLDGTQAQVSFHAVQAETRQALEQSLPDLAAALQGQGLTLSGGGVFQQFSREPKSGDAQAGSADARSSRTGGSSARVGDAGGPTPAATRRAVGLLDTFA